MDGHDWRTGVVTVQNAYGAAIDARAWTDVGRCFTEDCVVDYGPRGRWNSPATFARWVADFHRDFRVTLHQFSTHVSTRTETGVVASCYLHAVLVAASDGSAGHYFGRYDDVLVDAGAGRWLIGERRYEPVYNVRTPGDLSVDVGRVR
jgi:hypothetical protein